MIGENVIEIGAKEFLDGMTSSPETDDGGFSPETNATNITATQTSLGVLYPQGFKSDKSTSDGQFIASCPDPDSGIGIYRYALTTTGKFYSIDSASAATLRQTGIKTYVQDYSDMVVYKNGLYATWSTDITLGTGANLTALDETWWVTTKGKTALTTGIPHPLLVFEDSLWIGDGNKLHKWDGTTATYSFLTLNTGLVITALGVDPSTGKMLISATDGIATPANFPRQAKVYVWDGFSEKPSRAVVVDDIVTTFYPMGGVVYVCYGVNLGYWTGSGIAFLRKFKNNLYGDTATLAYKHRVTNVGKKLLIADGVDVLAMEDTLPGKRRFYVAYKITTALNSRYDIIFNLGSDNLGMCFTSTGPIYNFAVLNLKTVSSGGSLTFYSKKYNFQRPVKIREVHIEYNDAILTTATPATISFINEKKETIAGPAITNGASGSVYAITSKYDGSVKFRSVQIYYENGGKTSVLQGIRRILVSYDVVE